MTEYSLQDNPLPTRFSSNGNEPFTVDEIIGNSPGWILHSGMTVLLIVVGIGIALTFVIRYPDKISSIGVITTTDPFKPLTTLTAGVVDTVFVDHDDEIREGDPVIYIENSANRHDVEAIYEAIENLHFGEDNSGILLGFGDPELSLGPMQSSFASLNQLLREYLHYLNRDDFASKLKAIEWEIDEINALTDILLQEKKLTADEVKLSNKDLIRNRTLYENGIISEREMEKSEMGHLIIRKGFLVKGNSIAQNRIRIAGLQQQITDIRAARTGQVLLYQSRIAEIILNFRNLYHAWFRQYYVLAPADGTIQLSSDIVAGQSLTGGESIGYVIPAVGPGHKNPEESNPKYAKVWVPSAGFGKISKGNRAIIHIDAYPYKEFGVIESRVGQIYPVAEIRQGQRFYEIHLPLESRLSTDYGHHVTYNPEMPVQVSIIAQERSLFNRIFDQFLNLLNHHVT